MRKIDELFLKLGLSNDNGLYITNENLWRNELSIPNRVQRLIERKIKPDAFFCFDNKPLILFFESPANRQELHEAIWNFNECPIAIIVDNDSVEIFNGFRYEKDKKCLEKLGGNEKLNDFTYFELVTGRTWEQYKENLDYKFRVDYHLLQNIKATREILLGTAKNRAKLVNAILGKIIFVRYLIDRKVKLKFDGKLRTWTNDEFCHLLDNPKQIQNFFEYLEDKDSGFNGDLFPLSPNEYKQVTKTDYQVLKRLLKGDDIVKGQTSLFNLYDFSIIPIEFISNVYELFIGKDNQQNEGAYYTPLFLVDYILKETVEKHLNNYSNTKTTITTISEFLSPSFENYSYCKVLDPACGSGIFLVETLRKIIERYVKDTDIEINSSRFKTAIKTLAQENIYGIDKDESAVQVAIFSIYLTLLDYLEPPAIERFKFPVLLGQNFFVSDFFIENNDFNSKLKGVEFNFILGNPPWDGNAIGQSGKSYLSLRKSREKDFKKKYSIAINNGEIAEGFMLRVSDFARGNCQIALIIKSTILYNRGYSEFSKFRQYLLQEFFIDRVFELAAVRHEVFDRSNDPAIAPAAVIFYRYANGQSTNGNVVEHLSLKASRFFSLFKIFTLNRTDFKKVEQSRLKDFDFLWKILVFGSYLDFNFIKRLSQDYTSISKLTLNKKEFLKGTGITLSKTPTERTNHLKGLPFIDAYGIEPFFVNPDRITTFELEKVGRRRKEALFTGPFLLIRNGLDTQTLNARAAIFKSDGVYMKALTGIKPLNGDLNVLRNISGLLSSNLYTYIAINTFGSIGIEREQTKDYEKFNIPYLKNGISKFVKKIEVAKLKIYTEKKRTPVDGIKIEIFEVEINENLKLLNEEIIKLIDSNEVERELINYALEVNRALITSGNDSKNKMLSPIEYENTYLRDYATLFLKRFRSKIESTDKKFIVEIWHTRHIVGMFFKTIPANRFSKSIVWVDKQNKDKEIISFIGKIGSEKITEKLFIQKDVRGFEKDYFYIFKPNERRLWHKAIAYLDINEFADAILKAGRVRK
ncbi:MAG: N-6 DNA methylase [Cyclobacteriaceae bacterium]|nr:N-6 DNA methylase [Cyclobacteriaceae bacterium]